MSAWLRHGALLLLAGALLSGCTGLRPRAPGAALSAPEQLAFLQKLQSFSLSGRVAGAVGKDGFNAQLELQQQAQNSRLVLRSPLGFGSATVETDGQALQFSSSRGEHLSGAEGLQALATRLGFEPPVRSLRFWLLGVPDPAVPAIEQVPVGDAPRSFEQQGWTVTPTELNPTSAPAGLVSVPRRVTIERPGARLRILIDKWHLD